MEWYEAIILGIVQGLTEFLPISSSGHLEIASYILKTNPSENLMFTVVVHIATAISILYVFRKDINEIIKGLIQFKKKQVDFILKILISSVPVGVVGVLFEKEVESFFTGNIVLVGSMLLITAALLFFTYFKKDDSKKKYFLYRCNSYRLSSGSSHTSRNFKVRIYNFNGFTFKCKQRESNKVFFPNGTCSYFWNSDIKIY